MKKIFIAIVVFAASAMIVNAQFEKGTVMVGVSSGLSMFGLSSGSASDLMNLGFSNVKQIEYYDGQEESTDESKASSFGIMPKVGYFAMDNLAVGIGTNYSRTKEKVNYDGWYEYYSTILAIGPFIRYYIPINSISPFVEANTSFGGVYQKSESPNNPDPTKDKAKLWSFTGGVGASFPIGMNASFDVMTGYTFLKMIEEDDLYKYDYKIGTFGISFGFKVFLGGYGTSADDSY